MRSGLVAGGLAEEKWALGNEMGGYGNARVHERHAWVASCGGMDEAGMRCVVAREDARGVGIVSGWREREGAAVGPLAC